MNLNTRYNKPLTEQLTLGQTWDKVFPKSDRVDHAKVQFVNRYGITLAADLYMPRSAEQGMPAIAVASPFGAVKEQSGGLYAQTLAERGFVTLVFDPSFTGESGGNVRNMSSPEINVDDFASAVDYLIALEVVDENRIGILGVCGWGCYTIPVAAMDTRVKALVSATMGAFDTFATPEERIEARRGVNAVRSRIARGEAVEPFITVPNPVADDAPDFVKDFNSYYCTPRGYHKNSVNSGLGWGSSTIWLGHWTFPIYAYANEVTQPALLVHGDKAYSYPFSQAVFEQLTRCSKELYVVPDASHTDLYDGGKNKVIPFDRIEAFFKEHL